MRVGPILFSSPMVKALLREIEAPGTGKTQTRRLLKPQPPTEAAFPGASFGMSRAVADGVNMYSQYQYQHLPKHPRKWELVGSVGVASDAGFPKVYDARYAVGDILYVRETWCHGPVGRDGVVEDWSDFIYRASNPEIEGIDDGDGYAELNADGSIKSCWKPSIHMPRVASRLTLEVTDVRVERLHDISDADAIAEGCGLYVPGHGFITYDELRGDPGYSNFLAPRMGFEAIWGEINGQASWEANPWVVAVTFTPHLINVDAFLAQRGAA